MLIKSIRPSPKLWLRPWTVTDIKARPLHKIRLSSTDAATRSCPELRILFCGSDEFSATSLRALWRARESSVLPIQSIDVVCRPPKRVGTGLKTWREVSIAGTARELGLAVHHVDTFKGWSLPVAGRAVGGEGDGDGDAHGDRDGDRAINLIVAVSFGLLIPARIVAAAAHGGVNVHPSLLPDFRGAAPVEHALLAGCSETGVSLQTLHPTKFDHGELLLQTPVGDIEGLAVDEVKAKLAGVGADLLVEGLRTARFVKPAQTVDPPTEYPSGLPVQQRTAFKIKPEDLHIRWQEWTASDILRRQKILGQLWSEYPKSTQEDSYARIKWSGGFDLDGNQTWESDYRPGSMFYRNKSLYIPTCDHQILRAKVCTPAGKPERQAHEAAQVLFGYGPSVPLR